mmetsp:Transcript_899/g.1785  ORF Transcript_899/g.1785 Transcript_899/m.1785 type:complete len:153 (-) Transcript_899:1367-1825(-)
MDVKNTGESPFCFTAALHSYFATFMPSQVEGLKGSEMIDSVRARIEGKEKRTRVENEILRVQDGEEIDRIFLKTGDVLVRNVKQRGVHIEQRGFEDTVVWNIGKDKAVHMKDLEEGGWKQYLCVETAAIGRPPLIQPSETWSGVSILRPLSQ